MAFVRLAGRITDDGQLVVKLPSGLPPGDVTVMIEMEKDVEWSDAEIREVMSHAPALDGAEVIARLQSLDTSEWMYIDDPEAWVEQVRRQMWRQPLIGDLAQRPY